MQTINPLYAPSLNRSSTAGMIGQGTEVGSIIGIRDRFIDQRIQTTGATKSYWSTKQRYFHEVEVIYNEPANDSIRNQLDKFWQSWQELSQYPEEMSHREIVKSNAKELSSKINNTFEQILQIRNNLNTEVEKVVYEINQIASNLATLNERIQKSKALGDNPK